MVTDGVEFYDETRGRAAPMRITRFEVREVESGPSQPGKLDLVVAFAKKIGAKILDAISPDSLDN